MHSFPFSFPGFTVTEVIATEENLTICVTSQTKQARCPACQQVSHRIHSYYQRCPRDLPISGQVVQLHLNSTCGKQTFAEPLPDLVGPTSRRTFRLTLLWTVFALPSGGEPGARLLKAVGTTVSPDTLLRLARTSPIGESSLPEILGVDEFAFRRGMKYGALLIDWERHQVVALLADRTAETLASWLQTHPGVKWISRDRSGEYARGAHRGTPEAQQVMHRWHVIKNWREALERVVSWLYTGLEQRLQKPSTPFKKRKKPRTVHEQAISDAAREQRLARYEEVRSYYQQGLSIAQIARQAHLTRTTVYTYLAAESFPERHPRSPSHLLERANSLLPTRPTCANGVLRDVKMHNSSIEKSMNKASQAIPGRCSDGCRHKDCSLADMSFASFKRIGEGKPYPKPLTP
ncbi:MAG TPA: ISL3 family transposase [Ktedonobacteraceae bacterium]|nr:ISL3 family transposase [Ktedonobacteraceae bacterium]